MATTQERLQQIMEEEHLRQTDIIERAKPLSKQYGSKLTRQDLSQYCHGKVTPSQQKLFLLAAALNVNEAWLMGYDVPRQRTPELQSLTDIHQRPAAARALISGSIFANDFVDDYVMQSMTSEDRKILIALRETDDRTRRMILYMLGINKELTDGESKKAE